MGSVIWKRMVMKGFPGFTENHERMTLAMMAKTSILAKYEMKVTNTVILSSLRSQHPFYQAL